MTSVDAIRGLLAGEQAHPANADYLIHALPPKRHARIDVLRAFDRQHDEVTPTRPYAHASPPQRLQGPGECAEWFAFAAADGSDGDLARWEQLAASGGRWRPGTRIALHNLQRGLRPPQSGHDSPHYFDDLAMVRAFAIALAAQDAASAAARTVADAQVTHGLDGVWCAEATAVLFAALLAGAPGREAAERAAAILPAQTWSHRLASRALELTADDAAHAGDGLALAAVLSAEVCDWIYSYPVAAPETLAVLLAHVSAAASPEALLLGTIASGRSGTVGAALAGAAAAILFGAAWIPSRVTLDAALPGIGIPALRGTSIGHAAGTVAA